MSLARHGARSASALRNFRDIYGNCPGPPLLALPCGCTPTAILYIHHGRQTADGSSDGSHGSQGLSGRRPAQTQHPVRTLWRMISLRQLEGVHHRRPIAAAARPDYPVTAA